MRDEDREKHDSQKGNHFVDEDAMDGFQYIASVREVAEVGSIEKLRLVDLQAR